MRPSPHCSSGQTQALRVQQNPRMVLRMEFGLGTVFCHLHSLWIIPRSAWTLGITWLKKKKKKTLSDLEYFLLPRERGFPLLFPFPRAFSIKTCRSSLLFLIWKSLQRSGTLSAVKSRSALLKNLGPFFWKLITGNKNPVPPSLWELVRGLALKMQPPACQWCRDWKPKNLSRMT